jgi:anti-sigma regulatory factor (Ser/Thr protein kinase)
MLTQETPTTLDKPIEEHFDKPLTVESWLTNNQTTLSAPSDLEWMDKILHYLQARAVELGACDEKDSTRIAIALHEALTNAVVHGNFEISSALKEGDGSRFAAALAKKAADERYASRNVLVQYDYLKTQSRWIITDEGKGFDVDLVTKPEDDNDEPSLLMSGRGLPMMRAFMDGVEYRLGGRQCILTLKHPAPPQQSNEKKNDGPAARSRFDALLDPFLNSLLTPKTSQHKLRKHERIPFTEQIEICDTGDNARIAFARNLSRGGIGFIADFKIISGSISITIPHPDGDVLATGQVVRNSKMTAGIYDVGVRFLTLRLAD